MAKRGRGAGEVTLAAGASPKQVRTSPRELTKDRMARFFEALGASCNVRHAADAAKVSTSAVYKRRQRVFRQVGRCDAGAFLAAKDAKANLLALAAVDIFKRPEPDGHALRPLADVNGVCGIGAASTGKFDQRGDLVAGGGGFEHGAAPRPSIE